MIDLSRSSKSTVNASLPDSAIERYYYEAKHSRDKRKILNVDHSVNVDVQYNGSELNEEQIELTEQYLEFKLYNEVSRYC